MFIFLFLKKKKVFPSSGHRKNLETQEQLAPLGPRLCSLEPLPSKRTRVSQEISWDILCLKATCHQGLAGSHQNDIRVNLEVLPNPRSQWDHLNIKKNNDCSGLKHIRRIYKSVRSQ